jgi:Secretion system C-terminal sorting domain
LELFYSNISNLSGIEFFLNLKSLVVAFNNLNNLEISSLTQLTGLNCNTNNLTNLNLVGLTALENINIRSNNFTSFNTSIFPNLKNFACKNNQISTLDFSNNLQLEELVCSNNNLTTINIKNGSLQNIGAASIWNDCWKIGNPNLTTICADANEVATLSTFLSSCNSGANPTIDSSCVLSNEQFVKNDFLVYPNPASSIVNVNCNINDNFDIELLDVQGQVLQSQIVSSSQTSLDISGLVNGVYFLRINAGNRTQIEKIIKE